MTVSRRDALLAGAAVPASAWLLTAHAQPPGAAPAAGVPGRDPIVAACQLIGGRKQIENCRFALEKLQNEDCRNFAKAEIEEHETIKKKMADMGITYPVQPAGRGAGGAAPPAGGDAAAPQPVTVSVGKLPLPPGAADGIVLDHEIAEQCIANYRKEMEPLTGAKLDKRFVGHQLDTHLELKDKGQVFFRNASPAMKPVFAEGLKIIEAHIATCKQLMEKLEAQK